MARRPTTVDAFLQDIREHPDDDTPRLVYADWLDDHGDPRRAEFIRLQCRLAALGEDSRASPELLDREWELFAVYQPLWQPDKRLTDCTFRRGFLARASVTAAVLLESGEELFETFPLEELQIREVGSHLKDIARRPWLARLSGLDLSRNALTVAALARSPHLATLRHLSLTGAQIGLEGVKVLLNSPHFQGLHSLDLCANNLGLKESRWLAGAPVPARLRHLGLGLTNFGARGVRMILESPHFSGLWGLDLSHTTFTDKTAQRAATATTLTELRRLCVGGALYSYRVFTREGRRLLAASPRLPHLLQLSGHGRLWPLEGGGGPDVLAQGKGREA
jgi:uncharacterized protein (TIGR02996 family)